MCELAGQEYLINPCVRLDAMGLNPEVGYSLDENYNLTQSLMGNLSLF